MVVVINSEAPLLNVLVSISKQVFTMPQIKEKYKICLKSEL